MERSEIRVDSASSSTGVPGLRSAPSGLQRINLYRCTSPLEARLLQHRVDVRKAAAARIRHQQGGPVAHEAHLLLDPQGSVVALEGAGIDRPRRTAAEDAVG